MKKLSGWQKAGLVAGIGCGSIVMLLLVGVVVAVVWARSTVAEYGDTTPTRMERTIALRDAATETPGGARAQGAAATGNEPLRLNLDLEEGQFTIRPGPSGTEVQVEGTYAASLYDLTEERDPAGADGAERTTIRFRSKAPALARMIAGIGGGSDNRPNITVTIPADALIDLSLRVSMGESRIDLGGLTLRELGLDLSMGNHQVDFSTPLVEGLRRMNLSARMGNVSVDNLGNARALAISGSGNMGNLTADLGGDWKPATAADLSFTHSMGELTLRVPREVRLETNGSSQGQAMDREGDDGAADPAAPVLRLRMSTSMGEGRVVRY
jgi:hypothetical protein